MCIKDRIFLLQQKYMKQFREKNQPGTVMIMTLVDAHNSQTALSQAVNELKCNHKSDVHAKIKETYKNDNLATQDMTNLLMADVNINIKKILD